MSDGLVINLSIISNILCTTVLFMLKNDYGRWLTDETLRYQIIDDWTSFKTVESGDCSPYNPQILKPSSATALSRSEKIFPGDWIHRFRSEGVLLTLTRPGKDHSPDKNIQLLTGKVCIDYWAAIIQDQTHLGIRRPISCPQNINGNILCIWNKEFLRVLIIKMMQRPVWSPCEMSQAWSGARRAVPYLSIAPAYNEA